MVPGVLLNCTSLSGTTRRARKAKHGYSILWLYTRSAGADTSRGNLLTQKGSLCPHSLSISVTAGDPGTTGAPSISCTSRADQRLSLFRRVNARSLPVTCRTDRYGGASGLSVPHRTYVQTPWLACVWKRSAPSVIAEPREKKKKKKKRKKSTGDGQDWLLSWRGGACAGHAPPPLFPLRNLWRRRDTSVCLLRHTVKRVGEEAPLWCSSLWGNELRAWVEVFFNVSAHSLAPPTEWLM